MTRFMKDRKVAGALLFILLVLLPVSLLFTAWLMDFQWWTKEAWTGRVEEEEFTIEMANDYGTLDFALKNIRCPAKRGLELTDYWNCLWHSSLTPEGRRQDNAIHWEHSLDQAGASTKAHKRVKRVTDPGPALPLPPYNASDPTTSYTWRKMDAIKYDLFYGVKFALPVCQQEILPGVSIRNYLHCLLKTYHEQPSTIDSIEKKYWKDLETIGFAKRSGYSLHSTFQPTTYPPMNKSYIDEADFPLITMTDRVFNHTRTYQFRVDFQPLGNEENLQNFRGADPYLEDDFSAYRYRYNNLVSGQNQVGWTYRGTSGSHAWHNLFLQKFYVPLKKASAANGIEFIPELAQSFPGIGELAGTLDKLKAPLDFKWTKDSGYNIYTRYLLPLIQKDDLNYYKSKGIIAPSVTLRPDKDTLDTIINELKSYKAEQAGDGEEQFVSFIGVPIYDLDSGKYPALGFVVDEEQKPINITVLQANKHYDAYLEFIGHFFGIDMAHYLGLKKKTPDVNHAIYVTVTDTSVVLVDPKKMETEHWEMELVRRMLRSYVDAVIGQEGCIKFMLGNKEKRVESDEDFAELRQKIIDEQREALTDREEPKCRHAFDKANAILSSRDPDEPKYHLNLENLRYVYDSYFVRKEARQRYTLPKYPIPFPICRHNDPSPIDIRTERSRQSSIRDYSFGQAAYRLNRFFMFFPLDGAPLLTVGIVDGQRLDDSSVRLTGGAVKGENLTFQYMHIHYAKKWDEVGSEHWINGKGATMELQMVFTISGSADPIKYWHVLARMQNQLFQFREKLVIILSVLVDVLESDEAVIRKIEKDGLNQDPYAFEALAQAAYLFRKMPLVNPTYEHPRGYVSDDPVFRFIDFIPRKSSKFYTYRGSLSWPPCFGYVIWSVYEQRLYMSKRQFDQFSEIPAHGIQFEPAAGYAAENYRKFSDIWVEEENNAELNYDQIEFKKNQRTIDRYILIGYHDVIHDEQETHAEGVVGNEFYYIDEDAASIPGASLLPIITAVALLYFL